MMKVQMIPLSIVCRGTKKDFDVASRHLSSWVWCFHDLNVLCTFLLAVFVLIDAVFATSQAKQMMMMMPFHWPMRLKCLEAR